MIKNKGKITIKAFIVLNKFNRKIFYKIQKIFYLNIRM